MPSLKLTHSPRRLIACLGFLAGVMLAAFAAQGDEPAAIDWAKARTFWAFQAPHDSPLPKVKESAWPRQRLDYFILSAMEQESLTPSREAEKRTLARRLYLDLSGLPPTPEELAAFMADPAPDAYDRLVENLLHRDSFGERLASMWMNLVRYAEDQAHVVGGDTSQCYPNAYKYRDWVINAFNSDLPYDSFVRKQLAADLLEPDQRADWPALGLLGLGHKLYARGRLDVQAEEWSEKVDTVSQALLGLTVACARCHDHKFDPITTRDYYAMAGVFASIQMVNLDGEGNELKKAVKAEQMDPSTIHVVKDNKPHDLPIYQRGDVESPGPMAPRGYLQILSKGEPVRFEQGSGREELANLIASPENPLTARVIVNRLWDMFFGKPLVRATSNFGHMGDLPTHPALLDDLACQFMKNGWSIKKLVRQYVLSATYRQSCQGSAANEALDQANTHWWRMERRRMTVEQFRDSVLSVAGTLDRQGGRSEELDAKSNERRTLYSRISRRELNKTLMVFDYPDANVHAARRNVSTTPTQKLFVLNSPFMLAQSKTLAERLQHEAADDAARVTFAYRLLFSREPEQRELAVALQYLHGVDNAPAGLNSWTPFAQALLATNEMMYVD